MKTITGPQIWDAEGEAGVISHLRGDLRLRFNRGYVSTHPGAIRRIRRDVRDRVKRLRDYRGRCAKGKAVAA